MRYIVIELQNPDWPTIVTNNEGQPLIFDIHIDAQLEAEQCQNGIVVPLSKNLEAWEIDDSMPKDWDDETKWPNSDLTVYL